MIRFISRLFLISTFFIGLGAIADEAKTIIFPAENYRLFETTDVHHIFAAKMSKPEDTGKRHFRVDMIVPIGRDQETRTNRAEKPVIENMIIRRRSVNIDQIAR